MAIYYVRISGSDSNNGLTPATAWRTFTKALGADGISSGDIVYIGAGTYRENVTIGMTSPTAETFIIGDKDGIYTGDAGDIILTNIISPRNLFSNPSGNIINLANRNYLVFDNIIFSYFNTSTTTAVVISTSKNINFSNCKFLLIKTGSTISITGVFGEESNVVFNNCFFNSSNNVTHITLPTSSSGNDYDSKIYFKSCIFFGGVSQTLRMGSSGGLTNKGGGIYITNCLFISNITSVRVDVGISLIYPVVIKNCLFYNCSTALLANTLGQIIEDYNIILAITPRTSVDIGNNSNIIADTQLDFNYSDLVRHNLNILGNKTVSPLLSFNNNKLDYGINKLLFEGIATSSNSNTLTDNNQIFGNSSLTDSCIKIINGYGAGQIKTINGNTNTVITGDGQWINIPDNTSKYIIYKGSQSLTSLVSSGSNITLIDNYASWGDNFWRGYTCLITSGNASGENFVVSGNSSTILSGWSVFNTIPNSGNVYHLYWGSGNSSSGINYIHVPVGPFANINTAIKETGIVLSGANSIRLFGPAIQNFQIPVSGGVSNTVNVWGYFNDYYSGVKPQMIIKDGSGIGVADNTGTMLGNSGQWEQISLSFTPTNNGIITAQLVSNTTGIGGSAYFDAFSFT